MKTDSSVSGVSPVITVLPVVLDVPLYGQQTPMWCWAASAQMVLAYIGITVEQCLEANHLFNLNTCCATPVPTECVRGGSPQLHYWGADFEATQKGTALSFVQLQAQIDAHTPVIFVWKWIPKGGHVMVATGYYESDGGQFVFVNNPMPPNQGDYQVISYADYVQNPTPPHAHTHGVDLYNISVASSATKLTLMPQAMDSTPAAKHYAHLETATAVGKQMAYALLKYGRALPADMVAPLNDVSQLTLGTPITVRTVNYKRLAEYNGHENTKNLFDTEENLLYPVELNGKTVSAVWLRPEGTQWAISSAGNQNTMNHIQSGLLQIPAYAAQAYAVHIPWLDQLFLAYEVAGETRLLHLFSDNRTGFATHSTQPAAEVFQKLAPMAQGLGELWEGML